MRFRASLCLMAFLVVLFLPAQHNGESNDGKNLKFSILGGPGFNPDVGFLLGGDAVLTFSTNTKDTTLKRSVIPVAMAYFTKGGGLINTRPQLFFNHDRMRVFGVISYRNQLDNYYGVGFNTNDNRERGENTTEYRFTEFIFNPILLFRLQSTDIFYGVGPNISNAKMSMPSQGTLGDVDFQREFDGIDEINYFNSGLTFRLSYDTRDIPANAHQGIFLGFDVNYFSEYLGSQQAFSTFLIDYRQYQRFRLFGSHRTLAWNISSRFSTGDIPLTSLSTLGSPFDLRGLYQGQYRDKYAGYALVEYRHDFDFGSRTGFAKLLSRTGFVTWTGIGYLTSGFESSSEKGFLPNYGAGFRFELQPRINFRVDVGRDPSNNQTLVYLNVTEAF